MRYRCLLPSVSSTVRCARAGALLSAALCGGLIGGQPPGEARAAPPPVTARERCVSEIVGFGFDPGAECYRILGIANLSAAARAAWFERLKRDNKAWEARCSAQYQDWARLAGYVPDKYEEFEKIWACQAAFVVAGPGGTDADRAAWMQQELKQFAAKPARPAPTSAVAAAPAPKPKLVSIPDLAKYYPKSALKKGIEGRAVASCMLGADGYARQCTIATSSGYAELDKATLKVIDAARWEPAAGGAAAPARNVVVPIRWELPD